MRALFKLLSLTREGKPANELANEIEAALARYDSDVLSAYQMLVTDAVKWILLVTEARVEKKIIQANCVIAKTMAAADLP